LMENSWQRLGCFTDSSSTRALANGFYSSTTTNSPASCLTNCANLGYKLAGLEFGVSFLLIPLPLIPQFYASQGLVIFFILSLRITNMDMKRPNASAQIPSAQPQPGSSLQTASATRLVLAMRRRRAGLEIVLKSTQVQLGQPRPYPLGRFSRHTYVSGVSPGVLR
jgi:hypothetical protein